MKVLLSLKFWWKPELSTTSGEANCLVQCKVWTRGGRQAGELLWYCEFYLSIL